MGDIVQPVYAKTLPKSGIAQRRFNLYIPGYLDDVKPVEITTNDPQIVVIDNSTQEKYSFEIDFQPQQDLEVELSMTPKKSGVAQSLPVLEGETIDEVALSWVFNKIVSSQSLSANDEGITHPALLPEERTHDYQGLSISQNTQFIISADDGKGLDGSASNDVKTVTFGNYYYHGHGPSLLGKSSLVQAFIDTLNKSKETQKGKTIYGTGGEDEHFFFAYPKSFGLPTEIKKGIFSGGYVRLINVGNEFKTSLDVGDVEFDLNISNGIVSKPYYLFQSLIDNQNDPNEPIVIK